MKFLKESRQSKILTAAGGVFTAAILMMRYEVVSDEQIEQIVLDSGKAVGFVLKLLYAIEDNFVLGILLVFFCFLLYQYSFSLGKLKTQERVIGILMAMTMLFGRAFDEFGTTQIFVMGFAQIVKTLLIFLGYLLFFPQLVKAVSAYSHAHFGFQNGFDIENPKIYRWGVFGALFVVWSIHLIAYFPGMFMGDTEDIIYMAYNYYTNLVDTVELISEDVLLVDHHSVLYTILLGFFVKAGRFLFDSENIGIFVYTVLQEIFTAWVLAQGLYQLKKYRVNAAVRTAVLLFFCFFPWIPRYAIMATKDTLFADFLMLYLLTILDIAEERPEKIAVKQLAALVVYAVLIFLLRKNGLYAVLLSLPFLLMLNKKWLKTVILVMLGILLSKFIYSDVILPAAQITDGSVSAALSIPLQQTSRYLKYYGNEVTQEEKEAILAVADYDALPEVYWPDRSDWAKACWKKEADSEDMKNYFVVWAKMLTKHPFTYVAATANNYYAYFYPVVVDLYEFERASDGSIASANVDGYFEFAASKSSISMAFRRLLRLGDALLMKVPFVNLLCTSALYIWMLIFAWTRSIVQKDTNLLMLVVPMLMLMLTILSGPCNGNIYHRFTYPVAMCIPIIAGYGFRSRTKNEEGSHND